MEKINTDVESFARIRVVGIGGSGNNAVNYMIGAKVKGVEFIAVNSDSQDLHHSLAKRKLISEKISPEVLVREETQTWDVALQKRLVKRLQMQSRDQT